MNRKTVFDARLSIYDPSDIAALNDLALLNTKIHGSFAIVMEGKALFICFSRPRQRV